MAGSLVKLTTFAKRDRFCPVLTGRRSLWCEVLAGAPRCAASEIVVVSGAGRVCPSFAGGVGHSLAGETWLCCRESCIRSQVSPLSGASVDACGRSFRECGMVGSLEKPVPLRWNSENIVRCCHLGSLCLSSVKDVTSLRCLPVRWSGWTCRRWFGHRRRSSFVTLQRT